MTEIHPAEAPTEHDIKILENMSRNLFDIWSEEIQKKKRDTVYDNKALDDFMSEFAIMVDNITRNKNIKDYISHTHGSYLTIEVPVRYS
jgi:hypothetical protein